MVVNKKIKFVVIFTFLFINFLSAREIDVISNEKIDKEEASVTGDFYDLDYEPSVDSKNIKVWDPWEKMNRKIYNFNEFFLKYFAKPLYDKVYIKITTAGMRKSIHNLVMNFRMPIIFANYVLQMDFNNAAKTVYSFTLNSTYGILGVYDLSGYQGVSPPVTDLGITLAKYRVPAGPYFILPFLGPNDVRGLLSWGTELALDPFGFNVLKIGGERVIFEDWLLWSRSFLFAVDNISYAIENFYDLIYSSFDPYIMMRDAYGQSQNYKINKVKGK